MKKYMQDWNKKFDILGYIMIYIKMLQNIKEWDIIVRIVVKVQNVPLKFRGEKVPKLEAIKIPFNRFVVI